MNTAKCSSESLLTAALKYARLRLPVIPLHGVTDALSCTCGEPTCRSVGKHPATRRGVAEATISEARILQWFSGPLELNLGIATGNGLVGIDIDEDRCGDVHIMKLFFENGFGVWGFPRTWAAETGRGWHHFFKADRDVGSRANLVAGVDIRGERSYIVAAPSRHRSGRVYSWWRAPWDTPLAPLPEFLYPLIGAGQRSHDPRYSAKPWNGELPAAVASILATNRDVRSRYERDAAGLLDASQSGIDASLSCYLLHRGVDPAQVEHALRASHMYAGLHPKRDGYYRLTVTTGLARVRDSARRQRR